MSQNKPPLQTHGRIVTQNSDLLKLLKEKTDEALKQSVTRNSSLGWTDLSNNNSSTATEKNEPGASALINKTIPDQSVPDLSKKGGNQAAPIHANLRGSEVFTVVNPAILRAVGITPSVQQESNFEHYTPRVLQNPSILGQHALKGGIPSQKQEFDVNNSSSREIAYNNYLSNDPIPRLNLSQLSQSEENREPIHYDVLGTGESISSLAVDESYGKQGKQHTFFSPEEVDKYVGPGQSQFGATPSRSNSNHHHLIPSSSLEPKTLEYKNQDKNPSLYYNPGQIQEEFGSPEHKVHQYNSPEQVLQNQSPDKNTSQHSFQYQQESPYQSQEQPVLQYQNRGLHQILEQFQYPQQLDISHSPVRQASLVPSHAFTTNMSNTEPVKRVYIESPTFTRAEEEEYRFVNSRIEEHIEDTYRNVEEVDKEEEEEEEQQQHQQRMTAESAKSKNNRRVHYEDSPPDEESSRYEDVNDTQRERASQSQSDSHQYVLRLSEPSKALINQSETTFPAPRQLPGKAPGLGHRLPSGPSYDPQDEDELEEETNYQVTLMTRIGENTKKVSDLNIPKLPLPDSDDEYVQDSLDFDGQNPPYNPNFVKDSLELYNGNEVEGVYQGSQIENPYSNSSPNKLPARYQDQEVFEQEQVYYQQGHHQHSLSNQQLYESQPQHSVSNQPLYESQPPVELGAQKILYRDLPNYQEGYGEESERYENASQTNQFEASYQKSYEQHQQHQHGTSLKQNHSHFDHDEPFPQQVQNYHAQIRKPNHSKSHAENVSYDQLPPKHSQNIPKRHSVPQGRLPGPSPQYSDTYLAQGEPYPQQTQHHPEFKSFPGEAQDPKQHISFSQRPRPQPMPRGGFLQQGSRESLGHTQQLGPPQGQYQSGNPQPQLYAGAQIPYSQPVIREQKRDPYSQQQQIDPHHPQAIYSQQGGSFDTYAIPGYEDQAYSSQGYSESQQEYRVDQYTEADTQSPLKLLHSPEKAKPDFIEKNRTNYGKVHKKSYKDIQATKKEEGAKLETIFIDPKLKLKKKRQQPNSAPVSNPKTSKQYMSSPQLNQKPSTAEELWARKANYLSSKKDPKKKGMLTKVPSDGGLPIINQNLRPQNGISNHNSSSYVHQPPRDLQQYQKPLALQPITQELFTEDGQRISVDVNLKLLSPQQGTGHHNYGYSEQAAWADLGPASEPGGHNSSRHSVGVPYNMNPAFTHLPPPQELLDYTYEDYPEGTGYPSSRDYESAPEYLDYSRPTETKTDGLRTNPYQVIPPISHESDNSPNKVISSEDSYVVQYRRQKEKKTEEPWYKIYNLKDYRKMQKEVRLGSLGPDLDNVTHKERIEKFQRQSDYARMVNERNKKQATGIRRPPSYPRNREQEDALNKRKMAVEYAKTVPKPQVKPNKVFCNEVAGGQTTSFSAKISDTPRSVDSKSREMDVIDLENLRLRHERDKQNVAVIQQNL